MIIEGVASQTKLKRRSPVKPEIKVSASDDILVQDDQIQSQRPTQWRELLSHSLSTLSMESSDSSLSSGYLARRKSHDSNMEEPGMSSFH